MLHICQGVQFPRDLRTFLPRDYKLVIEEVLGFHSVFHALKLDIGHSYENYLQPSREDGGCRKRDAASNSHYLGKIKKVKIQKDWSQQMKN